MRTPDFAGIDAAVAGGYAFRLVCGAAGSTVSEGFPRDGRPAVVRGRRGRRESANPGGKNAVSIEVLQCGLGAIGAEVASCVLEREGLELAGVVDPDPGKAGRPLGEVLSLERDPGVVIHGRLEEFLAERRAQVALHTTSSRLAQVGPQIEALIRAGISVVSSTEELSYPWYHHPELAGRIDALAREKGVAVLGTGVNPGFVMDVLALELATVCRKVEGVRCRRVVDVATRRRPLQVKVGTGMREGEFRTLTAQGKLGHVGLVESVACIAAGLGWNLDRVQETIEPVLAEEHLRTEYLEVKPGDVAGLHQVAQGIVGGEARILLDLQMSVGARDPRDTVDLIGDPPLRMNLEGGTPGDAATVARLVNSLPRVLESPPGLVTLAHAHRFGPGAAV